MAQLVAHLLCKQGVRGSSPLGSTTDGLGRMSSQAIVFFRGEHHVFGRDRTGDVSGEHRDRRDETPPR